MTKPVDRSPSQESDSVVVGVGRKVFPPGAALEVCSVGGLKITCTEGVLRGMLDHAQKGLPRAEGGTRDAETVEVNGALLGRVKLDGSTVILQIEEIVPFPIDPDNQEDVVVYTAAHAQMV